MTTETLAAPRLPAGGPWQTLATTYERLAATPRGYVWLNKLGPAYLFGLVAGLKTLVLVDSLAHIPGQAVDVQRWLFIAHQAVSALFFGLIAAMYLLRHRPLRRVEGPLQGAVALIGAYIMLPAAFGGVSTDQPALLLLADVLMIVGLGGAAFSLAALGRCFAIFPEARGLVTHGPYRFVRHPMYSFEFIAFLGVLLPAFTPLNASLYSIFVATQLWRMRFEEQALAGTFPDEYQAYGRRTARLIPGLY